MLILLGNGIIQQPISYYHEIYALLSQKVFCPQSKIPFLQPLVVDARKHWQGLQPGTSWGWDKLLVLVQWPSDWDQSPCIVLAHACRIASRSRWNQSTMKRCSNIWDSGTCVTLLSFLSLPGGPIRSPIQDLVPIETKVRKWSQKSPAFAHKSQISDFTFRCWKREVRSS